MTWPLTGDEPLPALMYTQIYDVLWLRWIQEKLRNVVFFLPPYENKNATTKCEYEVASGMLPLTNRPKFS